MSRTSTATRSARTGRGLVFLRRASLAGAALLAVACQSDADERDDVFAPEAAAQVGGGALPAGATALFPAPGASSVCPDAPLRVTFGGTVRLGRGRFSIARADQPTRVVASVDVAGGLTETRGGQSLKVQKAAYVDGNSVVAYLPYKTLSPGVAYIAKMDAGAVEGKPGITDSTWRFTTAARPGSATALTVGYDGASDFCTLQGAIDAAGAGATIQIKRGTYHSLVNVTGKSNLKIRGEDRADVQLVGTNNDKLNGGTAKRAFISFDRSSGITIENLSIRNLTPQGGSQAEALRLQRCDKCVVRDTNIRSLQDTLLWDGKIYAENIYVEGNVDYVWGYGGVFFKNSEFKTVGRKGYLVQARNAPNQAGYAFVDCKLTADPGINGMILARIDVGEFPGSQVAFINCQMGSHIAPAGWTITGSGGRGSLRFQEYGTKSLSGGPLNVGGRSGGRQISAAEAQRISNPSTFLGWTPPAR